MVPPPSEGVVAVGECGLDTTAGFPPLDMQIPWFEAQLDLAFEMEMPLYLHERGAHETFTRLLRSRRPAPGRSRPKLLVHCFTGNENELRSYLGMDAYVSISGMVCRPGPQGEALRAALRACPPPPHRLLVETDAPYMGFPGCRPAPSKREFPNVPSALPHVVAALAVALGRDPAHVARDSFHAACEFFGVDVS